jgi:hypothetical protein
VESLSKGRVGDTKGPLVRSCRPEDPRRSVDSEINSIIVQWEATLDQERVSPWEIEPDPVWMSRSSRSPGNVHIFVFITTLELSEEDMSKDSNKTCFVGVTTARHVVQGDTDDAFLTATERLRQRTTDCIPVSERHR